MKLSENIKRIRKENNLSQEQFAEKIGVSRQAVSKWESGQSYPEMDKVLLICKLYNYNIDELMNENVKEVSETKKSKTNINKYIDDFFSFITKTIDMLSSMKFSQKLKCFIEQCVIALLLFIIFIILGAIGSGILQGVFGRLLPNKAYYFIHGIFESIYLVFGLVVGITILFHIFKVRYLDYYDAAKKAYEESKENSEDGVDNDEIKEVNKDRNLQFKDKRDTIVIRDPDHSQSKFINGIVKLILLCVKGFAIFMGINFGFSFIGLVALLVISFLFVKTGLIFIGALLGFVSGIVINFVVLEVLYNFVMDRLNHKTRIGIMLITALIMAGISFGTIVIGVTHFDISNENVDTVENEYDIQMEENLIIKGYGMNVEYIPEDRSDVKVVVKSSNINNIEMQKNENVVRFFNNGTNNNFMEAMRLTIKDINNKQIKDYYYAEMYVYASNDNINKMQGNAQKEEQERQQSEINNLKEKNEELEKRVEELENELDEKNTTNELQLEQISD